MDTTYQSICECLRSYDHEGWDEWGARVERHHGYCCQERQRDPQLDTCLVGDPDHCPWIIVRA